MGGFRLGAHAGDAAMVDTWMCGATRRADVRAQWTPHSHSHSLQQFWWPDIFANMSVFCSCHNRSPQCTKEHKTTEIYCLAVLEAESLEPRRASVNIYGQELFRFNVLGSDFLCLVNEGVCHKEQPFVNDGNYGNFPWSITNRCSRRGSFVEKDRVELSQRTHTLCCVLGTVLGTADMTINRADRAPAFTQKNRPSNKRINEKDRFRQQ